ncbi:MAG: ABC-type nitrate/sulfonate/bicarbonate transport system [Geminicoccaceae bacterium]|jgi:NitT/TauT family transport system substrate-binding protein|nr:ABC-type nitrate/sulfonate/bicarbonate transport system [Microvirga sp.]MCE3247965.1 ABC-type nitrate/sulfonate/bicarbonate transport system [Geminicoccaceae bacterium]
MRIRPSRRDFLASASLAAGASILGGRAPLASEGPPETTTIRIRVEDGQPYMAGGVAENALCIAPALITEDLLRAEGFTDIRYVRVKNGPPYAQALERGEIDFGLRFAPGAVRNLDAGVPITVLAGVHPGCFNLFVHEHIRAFTDLKGKQVGCNDARGSPPHLYVSIMAAHVGLDPEQDIDWVTTDDVASPIELFIQGKSDAYLAFVPEFPELRAGRIGRVLVDMAMDRPWSQYFCCILVGQSEFVQNYPVATKRAVRAILKATDLCATEPERAARQLLEGGFAQHYDIALQTLTDVPYNVWRELDPEDSLRFYGLWLHEFGMIEATPNQIIAEGADWRFLDELKRELKA